MYNWLPTLDNVQITSEIFVEKEAFLILEYVHNPCNLIPFESLYERSELSFQLFVLHKEITNNL